MKAFLSRIPVGLRVLTGVALVVVVVNLLAGALGQERENFDPLQTLQIAEADKGYGMAPEPWETEGAVLMWRSSTRWFIGGVSIKDVGYAVRVPGGQAFWALDAEKIAELQQNDILPETMPKGSIALGTWLMGHSLWLLLGAVWLAYAVVRRLEKVRKGEVRQ